MHAHDGRGPPGVCGGGPGGGGFPQEREARAPPYLRLFGVCGCGLRGRPLFRPSFHFKEEEQRSAIYCSR